MSEINNALNALTGATGKLISVKESFEAIRQDASLAINDANSKVNAYILGARSEYSRFNHYVPFANADKVVIPALGLSDDAIENYSYIQESNYSPERSDGVLCFADIPEFSNGFSEITIPEGLSVYVHLLVNVAGANTSEMKTKIHILRERKGQQGFHKSSDVTMPFTFNQDGNLTYELHGRDWGDSYKDRNELKVSNFDQYNVFESGALRILNLGGNTLEIFGVGIEVRV